MGTTMNIVGFGFFAFGLGYCSMRWSWISLLGFVFFSISLIIEPISTNIVTTSNVVMFIGGVVIGLWGMHQGKQHRELLKQKKEQEQ